MATEAALVARLEARMDKYEKAMKGAEETADKTVKGIENSFASTTLGTTLGTSIGNAIGGAIKSAAAAVDKLIERFNDLTDTARTTGLSLGQVFALQSTGDPDKINAALEKMNTLLDKAKRGEDNSLSKILKLNDIDVNNVKDVFDLWTKIAALVKNAANVEQGKQIAEAAGAGRELETALMKAADQGDRLNETAAKMVRLSASSPRRGRRSRPSSSSSLRICRGHSRSSQIPSPRLGPDRWPMPPAA
jgi:hypothetical protein